MLRSMLLRAQGVSAPAAAASRRAAAGVALRAAAFSTSQAARSGVTVTAAQVKELREMTGAPMMDCKNALVSEGGDLKKAVDWLRKKGVAAASKKAGRVAAQGLVAATVSPSGETGVLVEINSETDFVARNELFQKMVVGAAGAALGVATGPAAAQAIVTGGPTGAAAWGAPGMEALKAAPLPGGEGGASVDASLLDLIAKIRENMVLRRAGAVSLPGGVVASYIHNATAPGLGSIGVLVGVTGKGGAALPAAARPVLADLARKVAMHVAAARPAYVSKAAVPAADVDRERAVLMEQARTSGKPENIIAKMVEGRVSKFYGETVLPEQPFVLAEDGAKVSKMLEAGLKDKGVAVPGGVEIAAFLRFNVGEDVAPAEEQQQ